MNSKDWRSTLAGIFLIALAGLTIWRDPATIADPIVQGQIVAGAGLIVAADSGGGKKKSDEDIKKTEAAP